MAVVHDLRRGRGWNLFRRLIRTILIVIGSLVSVITVLGLFFTLLGILNKYFFHSVFLTHVKELADSYFEFILIPFFRILDLVRNDSKTPNLLSKILVCVLAIVVLCVTFRVGKLLRWLGQHIDTGFRAGDEGERLALDTLRMLPDDYHVFANLEFKLRGHHETDLIVVGPEGVCVCEVKYWKGEVYFPDTFPGANDKIVMRTFPNGRKRSAYSPRDQVRTHCETLRDALRGEGVDTPVGGMVLMMYPGVRIINAQSNFRIPVFKSPSAEQIRNHLGNQDYSAQDVAQIVAALEKIAL